MVITLTIIEVDDLPALILPNEILAHLGVGVGDTVYATDASDAVQISRFSSDRAASADAESDD